MVIEERCFKMKRRFFVFYNKIQYLFIYIHLSNRNFIELNNIYKNNFYINLKKYKIKNISIEKLKSLNYTKIYNILKKDWRYINMEL